MTSEATIALVVFLGGSVLVAGIQTLPPLDSWEGPTVRKHGPETKWLDGAPSEIAYCQTRLRGIDCACFANKAAQVMRNKTPEAPGWTYADRLDLALQQTRDTCG